MAFKVPSLSSNRVVSTLCGEDGALSRLMSVVLIISLCNTGVELFHLSEQLSG